MTARLARFYGWTEEQIDTMKYTRVMAFEKAMYFLQTEENHKMLDFISFPHQRQETKRQILEHYFNRGFSTLDSTALALRCQNHIKYKDREWPKGQ